MDVIATLDKAADYETWRAVPSQVTALYKQADAMTKKIKKVVKGLDTDGGYGTVWWDADAKTLCYISGDWWDTEQCDAWDEALGAIAGVDEVWHEAELGNPGGGYIKVAKPTGALEWFGRPHLMAQSMAGGPSPLTSTIVSSLIGGGLGYGGGKLLEKLFPERYVERGKTPKTLALLGALGGSALPAWRGIAKHQLDGPQAWVTQDTKPLYPWSKQSDSRFADSAEELADIDINPQFTESTLKFAAGNSPRGYGGAYFVESVPVDAFNNAVWNDVRPTAARYNPVGSKDPWGTNDQRMFTPPPPPVAAMATGLMSGVQAQTGKSFLSPWDIARGLVNAGIGAASAKAFGGLAGAFFGVTPTARRKLEDAGALGGFLMPIMGGMFR